MTFSCPQKKNWKKRATKAAKISLSVRERRAGKLRKKRLNKAGEEFCFLSKEGRAGRREEEGERGRKSREGERESAAIIYSPPHAHTQIVASFIVPFFLCGNARTER
jgi:hypothetical protein